MTHQQQHDFYLRLLFDEEIRTRFMESKSDCMKSEGISDGDAEVFLELDLQGLEFDANIRSTYLMSALCRPYVMTAAALGAAPGGPERLRAFLASKKMFASMSTRNLAFGDHLARILDYNPMKAAPPVIALLQAVLAVEKARVQCASLMRTAIEKGEEIPQPKKPGSGQMKRGKLILPAYFLVAELPCPMELLQTALNYVEAQSVWHVIIGGTLDFGRVVSVARGNPSPVTVVSRGVVHGMGIERAGAGGISPLVDVSHRMAELHGRLGGFFASFDGSRMLSELPGEAQRLTKALIEKGLLELTDG